MSARRIPYPSPWFSVGIGLLAAASVFLIARIRVENDFQTMLEQSSEEARVYEDFVETFGNDEFVLVAYAGKPLFDEDALDVQLEVLEALEASEFVATADGIPAVFRDRFGAEDPEALEEELTSTPFYKNLFVSPDGTTGGMMAQLRKSADPEADSKTVRDIRAAVQPLRDFGFEVYLVGGPVMSQAIGELSKEEGARTFAVALTASLVMLFLLVRSFRAAFTVIACGAVSLLITYGAVGAIGGQLNIVTSSMPPILWVLMLANCIHVVVRYQFYRGHLGTAREAAHAALDEVWLPCTLAAVTTALGFSSLMVAELKPVQEFGVYCGIGMIVSLVVNLVLGPHLMVAMRARGQRWAQFTDGRFFERVAAFDMRHPYPIILLFVVLTGLGAYSASRLSIEPNPLSLLPQDSETVRAYEFVAKELTGFYAMEIAIETPGGWLDPKYWTEVGAIAKGLTDSGIVARTISPLDFLMKVNQWEHDIDPAYYKLPESREEAERLMEVVKDAGEDQGVRRLVTADGKRMRISVLIDTSDSNRLVALVQQARDAVAALPAPMTGIVTGIVPRMQSMQFRLINTQMTSFGLSFAMVFACILVGMRSFWLTGASVLPNLVPILSVFSVMVVAGIPLDAATVMVASISMGTAVDNCVHLLTIYRLEVARGQSNHNAIRHALGHVGPSITTTTLVGVIGFFALLMSKFVPIYYFGMLAGIAMLAALSAPVFFLPALLSLRRTPAEPHHAPTADRG